MSEQRNGENAVGAQVERAITLVRKRWKATVLLELSGGVLRFSQLQARLPSISHKVLIEVLRELEADGLLVRSALPLSRKHVVYGLTPSGAELIPLLRALGQWSSEEDGD